MSYLYPMNETHPVVLFDGVCNLCNHSVQFIIRRDKKDQFRFAALQGKTGQEILARHGLPADSFPWSVFYVYIIIPRFIRDGIYRWIARNRYRWFGRQESCMIPTPELRKKFVD